MGYLIWSLASVIQGTLPNPKPDADVAGYSFCVFSVPLPPPLPLPFWFLFTSLFSTFSSSTSDTLFLQFNSIQLVTWYSTLLNAEHYGRCFTVVCLPGHCYMLYHSFIEGKPPSPRSTPWGAYRPTVSCQAVTLCLALVGSTRAHSQ